MDGEVLRSAAYLWYFLSLVVLKKKVQASRPSVSAYEFSVLVSTRNFTSHDIIVGHAIGQPAESASQSDLSRLSPPERRAARKVTARQWAAPDRGHHVQGHRLCRG